MDGGRAYRCARCGDVKDRTAANFYFDQRGHVTGFCRPCHAAHNHAYYAAHHPGPPMTRAQTARLGGLAAARRRRERDAR